MLLFNIIILYLLLLLSRGYKNQTHAYCGLIGYIGNIAPDPMKIKLLFMYNLDRGKDSSGIYCHVEGQVMKDNLIKKVGATNKALLPDLIINPASNLIIGHTRASTMGVINENNSHPYNYGDVVGAHNGRLKNYMDMCRKYGFDWYKDYYVDSQVLISALSAFNDYRALQNFDGAAAVLFTKNDNKLYAYHNSERPLFKGYIKDGDTWGCYFSSLEESLKAIGCTSVKALKEDYIYVFSMDGKIKTNKIVKDILNVPYQSTSYSSSYSDNKSVAVAKNIVPLTDRYFKDKDYEPYVRYSTVGLKSLRTVNKDMEVPTIIDYLEEYIHAEYQNGCIKFHKKIFNKALIITHTTYTNETIDDKTYYYENEFYNDGGFERKVTKVISAYNGTSPKTGQSGKTTENEKEKASEKGLENSLVNSIGIVNKLAGSAYIVKIIADSRIKYHFADNGKTFMIDTMTGEHVTVEPSNSSVKPNEDFDSDSPFKDDAEEEDFNPVINTSQIDFTPQDDDDDMADLIGTLRSIGNIRGKLKDAKVLLDKMTFTANDKARVKLNIDESLESVDTVLFKAQV